MEAIQQRMREWEEDKDSSAVFDFLDRTCTMAIEPVVLPEHNTALARSVLRFKRDHGLNRARVFHLRRSQMAKRKVNAGERYGQLVILAEAEQDGYRRRFYCQCDCGQTTTVSLSHLTTGGTLSCGCLRADVAQRIGSKNARHQQSNSPTYYVWASMKQRCSNPKAHAYASYGGRGIQVCSRWDLFDAFLEDMGEKPDGLTLDRKDNDKGYSKDNCRWATCKEQSRNCRTNRLITAFSETLCLAEWSERTGLNLHTIRNRLNAGWAVEHALTTPAQTKRKEIAQC